MAQPSTKKFTPESWRWWINKWTNLIRSFRRKSAHCFSNKITQILWVNSGYSPNLIFPAFSSKLYVVLRYLLFCWKLQCASAVPTLIHLVLGMNCLYYLKKVQSGTCRLCAACQNQWSVKLQHQTARIIAQKGANVPATFTEHFYNDWIKMEKKNYRLILESLFFTILLSWSVLYVSPVYLSCLD